MWTLTELGCKMKKCNILLKNKVIKNPTCAIKNSSLFYKQTFDRISRTLSSFPFHIKTSVRGGNIAE